MPADVAQDLTTKHVNGSLTRMGFSDSPVVGDVDEKLARLEDDCDVALVCPSSNWKILEQHLRRQENTESILPLDDGIWYGAHAAQD